MTISQCHWQARKTLPRPHDMMVARDFMTVQVPAGGYSSQNRHSNSKFYTETPIPMIGASNYIDSSTRKETFQDASHGVRHPSSSKPFPKHDEDSNFVNGNTFQATRPPPPPQYASKPRIHREAEELPRKTVTPLRIRDQTHQFNAENMDIWDFKRTYPVQAHRTGPTKPPPGRPFRPA